MEIAEHLVMDDLIVVGDELCIKKNLFVNNENAGIVSLTCADEDLHVATNMKFVAIGVDSLVVDVVEDLHDTADLYVPDVELLVVDMAKDSNVSLVADLSLHVADMDFMFEDIFVASCD